MDKPHIDAAAVYGRVANLLPQEGRDFKLDAAFGEGGKTKVIITPLTDIGRAWVPFLAKDLASGPMGSDGVSVSGVQANDGETLTIRSVRAAAEAEAAEALRSRIEAATRDTKEKAEALDRRRRIGGDMDEISKASALLDGANSNLRFLRRVEDRVKDARAFVDASATDLAKADEKNGKVWAVDMDAPLTSLFDIQDAQNKFRRKEKLVTQIAERMVDLDNLRTTAAEVAKQYIIDKKGK